MSCQNSLYQDDSQKSELYKKRAAFLADSSAARNIVTYLRSIELKPRLQKLNEGNIGRALQLIQKTNQFNLRSVRYTSSQLQSFDNRSEICFLVGLEDCYGDHGLIGIVVLRLIDDSSAFIDTFALSCRVLGRFLESWVLSEIVDLCNNKKIKTLYGEFVASGKNSLVKDFYINHGFDVVDSYELGLHEVMDENKGVLYRCYVDEVILKNLEAYRG